MLKVLLRLSLLTAALSLCAASTNNRPALSLSIDPMVVQFGTAYGAEQHESIAVSNFGSKNEIVLTRSMDWRTSRSGDVMFEKAGAEGSHSITRYLQVLPASFLLHAGESRVITISLRMPPQGAVDATTWGGFILQAVPERGSDGSVTPGGTVVVYNSIGPRKGHIRIVRLDAMAGPHPDIRAELLNDSPTYVRPTVRFLVEKNGEPASTRDIPTNVILPGDSRSLTIQLPHLSAGDYQAHLVIDYGADSVLDGATHVHIP